MLCSSGLVPVDNWATLYIVVFMSIHFLSLWVIWSLWNASGDFWNWKGMNRPWHMSCSLGLLQVPGQSKSSSSSAARNTPQHWWEQPLNTWPGMERLFEMAGHTVPQRLGGSSCCSARILQEILRIYYFQFAQCLFEDVFAFLVMKLRLKHTCSETDN